MGQMRKSDMLADVLANLPTRVHGIISRQMLSNAGGYALCRGSRYWRYDELATSYERIAVVLSTQGVRPGDRVMIIGENSITLVALLFALSSIDTWAVMVNARLSAREIDTIREHCGARLTIYLTEESSEAAVHAARHASTSLDLDEADRKSVV